MGRHKTHDMQQTSLIAYDNLRTKLGERQLIILKAINELCSVMKDCTDSELMNHLMKQDPNYVRPRRFELVNKFKLVTFSRKRVCKITGETCMAWKILKGGIDAIREMQEMQEEKVVDKTFEGRESQTAVRESMQEVS